MARPKLHEIYQIMIRDGAASGCSNYEIVRRISAAFDDSEKNAKIATGQRIPSERTVRRYKDIIKEEKATGTSSGPAEPSEIDEPWQSMRKDPDGIPLHVCDWIATNILTNYFIMHDYAMSYPTFTDHLDAVTRRTAMWISTLFNRLDGEHPQLIWSIAWMYSGDELLCERQKKEFNTRAFDYYVAAKPWSSAKNRQRYEQATNERKTADLRRSSICYTLHLLQIQDIPQSPREDGCVGKEVKPNSQ
jgi:hypothetical protein